MDTRYGNEKLNHQLSLLAAHKQPYQTCNEISKCLTELIQLNETEKLREGFENILSFYSHDDDRVSKIAIQNVLLYNVATNIIACSNRREILKFIPEPFKKIMIGQFTCAGI